MPPRHGQNLAARRAWRSWFKCGALGWIGGWFEDSEVQGKMPRKGIQNLVSLSSPLVFLTWKEVFPTFMIPKARSGTLEIGNSVRLLETSHCNCNLPLFLFGASTKPKLWDDGISVGSWYTAFFHSGCKHPKSKCIFQQHLGILAHLIWAVALRCHSDKRRSHDPEICVDRQPCCQDQHNNVCEVDDDDDDDDEPCDDIAHTQRHRLSHWAFPFLRKSRIFRGFMFELRSRGAKEHVYHVYQVRKRGTQANNKSGWCLSFYPGINQYFQMSCETVNKQPLTYPYFCADKVDWNWSSQGFWSTFPRHRHWPTAENTVCINVHHMIDEFLWIYKAWFKSADWGLIMTMNGRDVMIVTGYSSPLPGSGMWWWHVPVSNNLEGSCGAQHDTDSFGLRCWSGIFDGLELFLADNSPRTSVVVLAAEMLRNAWGPWWTSRAEDKNGQYGNHWCLRHTGNSWYLYCI